MTKRERRKPVFTPTGDKSSWEEQAEYIVENAHQVTDKDIPNLFVWLQDINWPRTKVISDYLLTLENRCVNTVKTILRGNDEVWIYFVLDTIVARWTEEIQYEVLDELLLLTTRKSAEEVDRMAIEICLENHLVEDEIKTVLRTINRY